MRFASVLLVMLVVLGSAGNALADKAKLGSAQVPGTRASLDCSGWTIATCGSSLDGDNTGIPNTATYYSCSGWNESGGEVVYKLTLLPPMWHSVATTLTGMICDVDVFILGSCDEDDCIAYGSSTAVAERLPPGEYYIVVDGYNGAQCAFTLDITCEELPPLPPPCGPSAYYCAIVDANAGPAEFSPEACGGVACWEWGAPAGIPDMSCGVPMANVWGTTLGDDHPDNAGHRLIVGPYSLNEYDCWCMQLCHYYDIEYSYDGGNVKISIDGGLTWEIVHPSRGYDDAAAYYNTPCVGSEPVFSGHDHNTEFMFDDFDLSSYVGEEALIAFDFGSDNSVTYPGWYINWFVIGGDTSPVEDMSWGMIKAMFK